MLYEKIVALVLVCVVCFVAVPVYGQAPSISAQSAIVLDADTGVVVFEKNSNQVRAMASTTKVMTALLAVEYLACNGDETVFITKEMVAVEGSSMGLREGDTIALSALVVGMLLPSGNDAATAAAIHIGGSLPDFALQMNEKAKTLGMANSNFVTPSGLDDQNHYSTAYDMALLTAAAIQNPDFLKVFSQNQETVTYSSEKKTATFQNHNKLKRLYKDCIGGKTGFTKKSGRCLVAAATRGGYTLVAVTLNAPDDWNDQMALFENGFANMQTQTLPSVDYTVPKAEGGAFTVRLREMKKQYLSGDAYERTIYLPRFLYAFSLKKGDVIGAVIYTRMGKIVARSAIIY